MFDGHLRLIEHRTGRKVIVWFDTKFTATKNYTPESFTNPDLKELKSKLASLVAIPSFKEYLQLLVVVTNRTYTPPQPVVESASGVPGDALDDQICIIARDGLTFGTSPWISLLSQALRG